jgi:polysaccharide pyruvyl transferase WcaK-like protein
VVNLNKNGAQFADEIIKDIKWYVNKWYKIYYIPVSKGNHSEYNDIEFLPIIKHAYPKADIEVVDRETDFARFVHIVSGASMVFSARLHLFLIASFLKVPTTVYPYQQKIIKMQKVIEKYFAH